MNIGALITHVEDKFKIKIDLDKDYVVCHSVYHSVMLEHIPRHFDGDTEFQLKKSAHSHDQKTIEITHGNYANYYFVGTHGGARSEIFCERAPQGHPLSSCTLDKLHAAVVQFLSCNSSKTNAQLMIDTFPYPLMVEHLDGHDALEKLLTKVKLILDYLERKIYGKYVTVHVTASKVTITERDGDRPG